jgi:hypothetical protein
MIDLRNVAGWIPALVLAMVLAGGLAAAAAVAAEPRSDACPEGRACPAIGPAPANAAASSGTPRPSVETPVGEAVARNSKSLRWNIQNRSGRRLELQLYSADRNWVWPSANRVYLLPGSKRYTIDISCKKNEKICYGAWLESNTRTYWGVGYRGKQSCRGCCYICGRGQTPLIKLVW